MIDNEERLVDGTLVREWADCVVPGCQYKRCAALNSKYCYPHSTGLSPGLCKILNSEEEKIEQEVFT
jgi:hypothetical protein